MVKQVLKILFVIIFVSFNSYAQKTSFIKNGTSEYTIYYVDVNARQSAEIAQKYIKEVINVQLKLKQLPKSIIQKGLIIGKAGSLFIFKGKFKAVLINYPIKEIKNKLYDIE